MKFKKFPKGTNHREIFVNTCERIAEPLKELGFKYRKSKNDIIRKDHNFIYSIYFRPHTTYGSTTFWVHFRVESDELRKWRCCKYQNEKAKGVIIEKPLDYLTKKAIDHSQHIVSTFIERERVISEVISQINDFAIPFFDRFQNVDLLIEEVIKEGFIAHRISKWEIKEKTLGVGQNYDDFIDYFLKRDQ